jgi:hypothetical protein
MACPICNDKGWVTSDKPFTDKRCECKVRESLRQHLVTGAGPEILKAKVIRETPLLVLNSEGKIETDLTDENLYIESSWEGFLPHLRRVLWLKGLTFHFRVVDDEMVKSVYLKERNSRSRVTAGISGDIYNSLDDLVGSTVDLVLVRFGCISWKKSEAPAGIMLECFNIRRFRGLPTWAISDPNTEQFSFPHSLSYSANLQAYFDKSFKKLVFEESLQDVVSRDMEGFVEIHESAEEATTEAEVPIDKPRESVSVPNTLDGPGGLKEKKPWEKSSKNRNKLPNI